jgi:hypothetical protein
LTALIAVLILLLLVAAVIVISAPLRRSPRPHDEPAPERGALEAARDAKYREIRDAELDYRTGKLSREDYELVSAQLRAEALPILDALAALDGESAGPRAE